MQHSHEHTPAGLDNNTLAFLALCNEYCAAMESARETERDEFVTSMIRLLPRIYIAATDLRTTPDDEAYISPALEEDYYESVRMAVAALIGEDDTYLEVFEEDMKYSDTPIAASVSEQLTDIFQSLYNFLEAVRSLPEELRASAFTAVKEDFEAYWSRSLCNVMRPLNQMRYTL